MHHPAARLVRVKVGLRVGVSVRVRIRFLVEPTGAG